MGVELAVGAGISALGGLASREAGRRAAGAAQDAAMAQQAEAGRQRDLAVGQATDNQRQVMALAQASPQELAALEKSYQSAGQNLDREQSLLAAIDPALMEASHQALKLLKGEGSGLTQAMGQKQAMQRAQLVNQIRAQYGPGGETSSVGQKLLQQFDMNANSSMQQANQGALQNAWGIANTDSGARQRAALAQYQGVGAWNDSLRRRQSDAQLNTGNALLSAMQNGGQQMIGTAGAQYTGDALRAQADQGLANQVMGIGGNMIGAGVMGSVLGKYQALKTTANAVDPMQTALDGANWSAGASPAGNLGWGSLDTLGGGSGGLASSMRGGSGGSFIPYNGPLAPGGPTGSALRQVGWLGNGQ